MNKWLFIGCYFLVGGILFGTFRDNISIISYWKYFLIMGLCIYYIHGYFSGGTLYWFRGRLEKDADDETNLIRKIAGYGAIPILVGYFVAWLKHGFNL